MLGTPDWYYRLRGRQGWIEAKLIPPNGRPPKHFTLEQLLWGEEETRHGGAWFLLGLREAPGKRLRSWVLYDAPRARAWLDGSGTGSPLLDEPGKFPTAAIVDAIAPRTTIVDRRETYRAVG